MVFGEHFLWTLSAGCFPVAVSVALRQTSLSNKASSNPGGKVVMDVEALASHCQSCGERAVLEAGPYQLALRGFNPPVVPMLGRSERKVT